MRMLLFILHGVHDSAVFASMNMASPLFVCMVANSFDSIGCSMAYRFEWLEYVSGTRR